MQMQTVLDALFFIAIAILMVELCVRWRVHRHRMLVDAMMYRMTDPYNRDFVCEEDGTPLMQVGTEAPEDRWPYTFRPGSLS